MSLIERAVGRLQSNAAELHELPSPKKRSDTPKASVGVARRTVEIDLDALSARGFVTPDGRQHLTAQEFRVIKRPLIANAFGRGAEPVENGRLIMVTSAFPGEGKSFCSINLAMSIAAERDIKVLLVDADVARPSVLRELGLENDAGLMDWLIEDGLKLQDLVLSTNVETLDLLPAGRRHRQATELLASASMHQLLAEMAAAFPDRVIIFDSPPLLVTTEARVLASYMGQIVLVVEAGKTPRDAVSEALATIDGNDIVGLVLNKGHVAEQGYHGGYGGLSGYGYGYGAN